MKHSFALGHTINGNIHCFSGCYTRNSFPFIHSCDVWSYTQEIRVKYPFRDRVVYNKCRKTFPTYSRPPQHPCSRVNLKPITIHVLLFLPVGGLFFWLHFCFFVFWVTLSHLPVYLRTTHALCCTPLCHALKFFIFLCSIVTVPFQSSVLRQHS